MSAHVRKFTAGEHAQQAQELLRELTKAMLCLADAQRKREYDAARGRGEAGPRRRRTLEEILLAGKAIDQAQLAKAQSYAQAIGLDTRDALVQQKMVTAEVMMSAYAESLGVPFVDLDEVGVDEALVPRLPAALARQYSCVPLMTEEGCVLMASPHPLPADVEEELRLRFNMPARTVLCTVAAVNKVMAKHYSRDAAAAAPAAAKPKKAKAKKLSLPAMPSMSLPKLQFSGSKDLIMICVVAFNIAVFLGGMVAGLTRSTAWTGRAAMAATGIVLFVGLAAAGVTYVVASRRNR
jgi:hypothetical protein